VLGDDAKRKEYDEVRTMGPMPGGMGGRGGPGGFTFNVEDMEGGGLGDLFGNMFGRGGAGRGRGGAASGVGPRRGADITAQLTVVVRGCRSRHHDHALSHHRRPVFDLPRIGSEARDLTGDVFGVRGSRRRRRQPGDVLVLHAVSGLRRPGQPHRGPVSHLSGLGGRAAPTRGQDPHPAGVKDGQTIRLKGRGGPGRNGGPAGDLLVELKVMPHPLFGRSGDNLTVSVPVTVAEAALGGDIDVPTLDGPTSHVAPQAGHPDGKPAPGARQGHLRPPSTPAT
jgi:molecular chaperone DnaJ